MLSGKRQVDAGEGRKGLQGSQEPGTGNKCFIRKRHSTRHSKIITPIENSLKPLLCMVPERGIEPLFANYPGFARYNQIRSNTLKTGALSLASAFSNIVSDCISLA